MWRARPRTWWGGVLAFQTVLHMGTIPLGGPFLGHGRTWAPMVGGMPAPRFAAALGAYGVRR